uniref:Uncharacterized protein n=1 Tax=Uncultured archaeon GZfos26G2 TaxID=3386331 RepID=Q64C20_UNCAG|nr:hypothetical protein GZ26D6_33 [uncultured archaeon GZfos26D6]
MKRERYLSIITLLLHCQILSLNHYTPKFYRRVRRERRGFRKPKRELESSCLKLCAICDLRSDKSQGF